MAYLRISWIRLVTFSLLLVAISVISTSLLTSRCMFKKSAADFVSTQKMDDKVIGFGFTREEPIFPWGYQALLRQRNNEKNHTIIIRRPKGNDLDPKPVGWPVYQAAAALSFSEIPAHRPPRAILLGFAKCGTSALLEFLDLHPKIVCLDWEPDYFCDRMYLKYDLKWYVSKMPPSFSDQITIEKSPCYIVEHDAHFRIHAMNSSLKLLVVDGDKLVTDPLSQIRNVEDFLGLSHEITEQDVYFDTEKGFYCMKLKNAETKCLGKSKGRKHVEIEPEFKKKLIKILRPYNEKFFKLMGQRFDWLQ